MINKLSLDNKFDNQI